MNRVVVLGPGGSGKTTFARALGAASSIPVTELDSVFWTPGLEPTPPAAWARLQAELCSPPRWILDGDLGPYDVLDVRLRRADTVVLFDLPTWRCVWRAWRRGPERSDFWRWLLSWRRTWRPVLLERIRTVAPHARLIVIRRPGDADAILTTAPGASAL